MSLEFFNICAHAHKKTIIDTENIPNNMGLMLNLVGQRGPLGPMGNHMSRINYTPFYLMIGVFFAAIVFMIYYFPMLEKVRTSKDLHKIIDDQDDTIKDHIHTIDVALRLLNDDEKKVVKAIYDSGGTMLQKDISYDLDISRVKTHRILYRLIQRGVVTAEKHFNTNKILLAPWLKD